ncbi:hypothetical protein BDA99DRAFT_179703 [Phascolomyces articulosus]|uniref:Galactose oxidase n=1 Tax=Phascolomyces articulosus TaxID=60185 RepID=A0AAD5PA87_9FUNG|nr:hypothetical protein BDA99DRAFT_179703 [Phascolomyces articulosus]
MLLCTRGHQAVLGQDNNTIFVFGGIRTVDTGGLQPGDEYEFPLQMNRYLISENRWIIGDPVESLAATRYDHQVVHVGSLIYLIGGRFPNPLNVSMAFAAPMNQIPIFDTSSGQWSYPNTTGGVIPQTRSRHSVTLINENQILLFGGQYPFDSGVIRQDYFYLLNINDLSWSNTQQISEEDGISFVRESGGGIRGHSAVLVGKNLFIMFGLTISGLRTGLTNRGWILDTERMAWVASMSGISPSDAVPPNSNPTETTSASSSVSGGTIAGAVVGSVAGVALIAGVAFFLIRRKRSQQPPSPPPQETNKKYNTAGGQYGNYTSFDSPPPPNYGELEHHNIVNNRNIRQPLSPTTHYSQDYSDNTTLQSPSSASGSHAPEKPDGGVQRLVLIPAKPDGA